MKVFYGILELIVQCAPIYAQSWRRSTGSANLFPVFFCVCARILARGNPCKKSKEVKSSNPFDITPGLHQASYMLVGPLYKRSWTLWSRYSRLKKKNTCFTLPANGKKSFFVVVMGEPPSGTFGELLCLLIGIILVVFPFTWPLIRTKAQSPSHQYKHTCGSASLSTVLNKFSLLDMGRQLPSWEFVGVSILQNGTILVLLNSPWPSLQSESSHACLLASKCTHAAPFYNPMHLQVVSDSNQTSKNVLTCVKYVLEM